MRVPLQHEYLKLGTERSFLLIGRLPEAFILFLETSSDEICQFLNKGDLIVVSAPEGGDVTQAAMLLELVRRYHMPLVVLPKGHPGSDRLKMVVSAGDRIALSCTIQRGTHPDQHVICSSKGLSGLSLSGYPEGIVLENAPDNLQITRIKPEDLVSGAGSLYT